MGKHLNRIVIVLTMLVVVSALGAVSDGEQGLAMDFSPPLNVSKGQGLPQAADIALDPAGGIYIGWDDKSVDLALFSRSVDGGKTFTEPVALAPSIGDYSYGQLRLASSHPGEVRAVFKVSDTHVGSAKIAYTGSNDGGVSFSQPIFVAEFNTNNPMAPDIATGWATAIVWYETDQSGAKAAVKYSQSVDGGATFTTPRRLDRSDGGVLCAEVALGGEGLVYAAWIQNDDPYGANEAWEVFFTRSIDEGATFSTPVNISNYPQMSWCPRMAVDGSGTIYLVWAEGAAFTDMKVLFTRSVDGGNSFAEPRILVGPLPSLGSDPAMAASGNGNLWISWLTGDPFVHLDGFLTSSTDSGATFSPTVRLPGTGAEIASVGPDVVHAVWNGIFYSRGVGKTSVIALAPPSLTVPAADADGTYTVSWGNSATTGGVQYILEEATDSNFTIPRTAYMGTESTTMISMRSIGVTYYYRVKAILSGYADSVWVNGGNGCIVTNQIVSGDVNGDKVINVFDALLTLQYAVGLYQPAVDAIFKLSADVAPLDAGGKPYGDGVVNVFDALAILRHAVNLDYWGETPRVNLNQIKSYQEATATPGSSMNFSLTGSDTSGNTYTATAKLSVDPPTTYNGVPVRVSKHYVSTTETHTKQVVSYITTDYITLSGMIYQTVDSDGVVCTPTAQTVLPATAKVGDSGDYLTLSCNDGTTDSVTWRVDSAINGGFVLVLTDTWKFYDGPLISVEQDRYSLNAGGDTTSLSIEMNNYSSGVTVSLSGNKI